MITRSPHISVLVLCTLLATALVSNGEIPKTEEEALKLARGKHKAVYNAVYTISENEPSYSAMGNAVYRLGRKPKKLAVYYRLQGSVMKLRCRVSGYRFTKKDKRSRYNFSWISSSNNPDFSGFVGRGSLSTTYRRSPTLKPYAVIGGNKTVSAEVPPLFFSTQLFERR